MKKRTPEEIKADIEALRDEKVIFVDVPENKPGGQSCGIITYPTVVEHEELGLRISVGYYRSNHRNRTLAIELFDLAFDGIVNQRTI